MFLTFLISLPALVLPNNKGWLRAHGWMVVFSAFFTLALGLVVWIDTLKTRSNLLEIWTSESDVNQSLLQQKVRCTHALFKRYSKTIHSMHTNREWISTFCLHAILLSVDRDLG